MSAKRKAAQAAAVAAEDEMEGPAPKRRKLPASTEEEPTEETPGETSENTTEIGTELLEQLKNARDKRNMSIITHFLTLPDRKKIPQYYDEVGLPMALDIIEGKLSRQEYPNLSGLEGDLKRMISNAKSFNAKASPIFSDAEKIRKAVSAFMNERNPAYKTPGYQAVPTPVPEGWQKKVPAKVPIKENSPEPTEEKGAIQEEPSHGKRAGRKPGRAPASVSASVGDDRRASSTPAVQDAEGAGQGFEGNTFQQAQDKIITELMNLTDDDNQLIAANFLNMPSRSLHDYYRLIKHPVCLKRLQKEVRGTTNRDAPTGQTSFRSWSAFEAEVSYIWKNASEYNEDDSLIVQLAYQLEEYFVRRLAEAKDVVAEPQPKVKLRMGAEPQKIKLKLGTKANSSVGVSVDGKALKRQQDVVSAGIDGQKPNGANGSSLTPAQNPARALQERSSSATGEQSVAANGIKRESSHGRSPAPGPSQPNGVSNSTMLPPVHLGPRVPSGSPLPQTAAAHSATSAGHYTGSYSDPHLRPAGKDAIDALITNLNLSTRPDVKIAHRFNLDIPASPTRTQQSVTITLPHTHQYLRIAPTLSSTLMHRPSKTFVTCNHHRQQALPQRDLDQMRPLYEHALTPGINTIEVEVIAGLPRGAPKTGSGPEVEIEKIALFVHYQGA